MVKPRVGLNAHLLSPDASYRAAGVSRYVARLLQYLPQVDEDAEYVAFGDGRARPWPGWEMRASRWRTGSPGARIAWEQMVQPTASRRARLDLLHAPVNVAPLAGRSPVMVTVHDLSPFLFPGLFRPARRAYQQRMTRWSVQRAAHVIADSESTRADLVALLDVTPERVTAIPLGVDEAMRPVTDAAVLGEFRRRQGLDRPYVLFVGTLEPRKNVLMLIDAFALLRARTSCSHRLVVAGGKGWYYEAIFEQVERLGLRDAVLFPGFVPDAELSLWYSAADVFVYPSLYEGFGLPPLEAMACGVPVIVSRSSSLPEAVGEAGVLVDPHDPEALAQEMGALLADKERRVALIERGLARAAQLTWRATAAATAAVYHRVLRERVSSHVQA
jgi:glycosyltransferase involved in cell wall biosynthesis